VQPFTTREGQSLDCICWTICSKLLLCIMLPISKVCRPWKPVQRGGFSLGHMPGIVRIAKGDSNSPTLTILQPERIPAQENRRRSILTLVRVPPIGVVCKQRVSETAMRERQRSKGNRETILDGQSTPIWYCDKTWRVISHIRSGELEGQLQSAFECSINGTHFCKDSLTPVML
jgi:hypothetical protein